MTKVDPREVRALLRSCNQGALGTRSVTMPGYPFVTLLPYALDGGGAPLFLISALAEHTRNLLADSRASLLVAETSTAPLEQPRATLMGHVVPCDLEPAACERYLSYRPEAADYLQLGDFRFFRMGIERVRLIGGFARMGWCDAPATGWQPTATVERELTAELSRTAPAGVTILGVDADGADLRIAGVVRRLDLDEPAGGAEALRQALYAGLPCIAPPAGEAPVTLA